MSFISYLLSLFILFIIHAHFHILHVYAHCRSLDVKERKKYIELVEDIKDNGGSVQIFITGTEKEKELAKLTGVAAILNFPI